MSNHTLDLFIVLTLALVVLSAIAAWHATRPKTPAASDTASWSLADWPPCDARSCNYPGTIAVTSAYNGDAMNLCPGHRDTLSTKGMVTLR